jgi:hypothetical protein
LNGGGATGPAITAETGSKVSQAMPNLSAVLMEIIVCPPFGFAFIAASLGMLWGSAMI